MSRCVINVCETVKAEKLRVLRPPHHLKPHLLLQLFPIHSIFSYPIFQLVDVVDSIVEQLQNNKEYTVTEIGGDGKKVNKITNYRAINSKTHEADVIKEISTADLVSLPFL